MNSNEMILYKRSSTPFYIHLPGSCQANCRWCEFTEQVSPVNWLTLLSKTVHMLPKEIKTCILVGGEPTISPFLDRTLGLLKASNRFQSIQLRTNGFKLLPRLHVRSSSSNINVLTRIELSRHSTSDLINRQIMDTTDTIYCVEIVRIIAECKTMNIPVGINCMLTDGTTFKDLENIIEYTKDLGFSDITFNKIPDDNINPTTLEKESCKIFPPIDTEFTPTDYILHQKIKGVNVFWKQELREIPNNTRFLYGIHFQQNGLITSDNLGNNLISIDNNGHITPDATIIELDDIYKEKIILAKNRFGEIIEKLKDLKPTARTKVIKKMRKVVRTGNGTQFAVGKKYVVIGLDAAKKENNFIIT